MLSGSLILIKTLLICFLNEHFTKEFIFKKHISINPRVPSKYIPPYFCNFKVRSKLQWNIGKLFRKVLRGKKQKV